MEIVTINAPSGVSFRDVDFRTSSKSRFNYPKCKKDVMLMFNREEFKHENLEYDEDDLEGLRKTPNKYDMSRSSSALYSGSNLDEEEVIDYDVEDLNEIILSRFKPKGASEWFESKNFSFHRLKHPPDANYIVDVNEQQLDKSEKPLKYARPEIRSQYVDFNPELLNRTGKNLYYNEEEYRRIKNYFDSFPRYLSPQKKNIYNERLKAMINEQSKLIEYEREQSEFNDEFKEAKRNMTLEELMRSSLRLTKQPKRGHHCTEEFKPKTIHDDKYMRMNQRELDESTLRLTRLPKRYRNRSTQQERFKTIHDKLHLDSNELERTSLRLYKSRSKFFAFTVLVFN